MSADVSLSTKRKPGVPLGEQLVVAATELTLAEGWQRVTMGRLADALGVSRQTVYNEVGGKAALAEALVMHELTIFLSRVEDAFEDQDDVIVAIEQAALNVLELARTDALMRSIVSASHGTATDLLPLLTVHTEALLERATTVVTGHVIPFGLPFDDAELGSLVETVVRLVLSHVMQPTASPAETARTVAWIAERVLRP